MRLAKVILPALLAFATSSGASAQSFERIFQDTGHNAQPRRAAVRAEWEKLSPGQILCVDSRLRRARRSVNTLIDRGISPTDNRVTGIVSDCRAGGDPDSSNAAATPSFDCRFASQPDEVAICATPELARLDRAVVEGYERMLRTDGSRAAKSVAEPLLGRRHACGADIDCIKGVQLTAIAAFQARGAPVQVPAPAQAAGREKAVYGVAGIQLGNNVVGSADYRDYACAAAQQYPGFTGCQRQLTERSRRRRFLEATSFLHAPDGSAVYINQNLEPVAMDENDAHDEISRLSETLGQATLLPMPATRGVRSGLIASWGAVSLQPLDPARTGELAAGTGDKLGVLVDTIGNPQRSAQLGLPIYRLGGGAGYVWSASWNGRGRGTLRMLAIDASRLPGEVAQANPSADAPASVSSPTAPTVVTAAPASPPPDGSKAAVATQPAPSAAAQSVQKSVAEVAAPEAKTPAAAASPPANVRVVGPPIVLQPTASAATSTPSSSGSASGGGLTIFSIAVIAVLVGALGYLFKRRRDASPAAIAETPAPAAPHEPVPQKMDLPALIPAESPASVAGIDATMEASRTDEAMADNEMGKRPGSGPSSEP
jgi:hypothetical protein